jgi:hypothetical protein
MNASEFIDKVCQGAPEQRETLLHLRRHVRILSEWIYAAQLADGRMLHDVIHVKVFLEEVDKRSAEQLGTVSYRPTPVPFCQHCHHQHEGRDECMKYLGEERICRCTEKVSA